MTRYPSRRASVEARRHGRALRALALLLVLVSAPVDAIGAAQVGPPGFADLVARVSPAVVNIATRKVAAGRSETPSLPQVPPGSPFEDFFKDFFNREREPQPQQRRSFSLGSGFIVDPEGYVVTNNHVIADADEISVVFNDDKEVPAKVVGRDPKTDLALLKIDGDKPFPFVEWADSDQVRVGDWMLAIGNPFGLGSTVTAGIVSARGRDIRSGPYDDYIQVDAAINRGNSGGPLFNMAGEVVGINTAILAEAQGLGFAIPINLAKWVADQLIEKGRVIRGWLGVVIQDVTPEMAESLGVKEGVIIAQVAPSSPAEKAGLRIGDVVVEVDGKKVSDTRDLQFTIMKTPPGQEVTLRVIRDGKELNIKARVGQMPEEVGQREPSREDSSLGLVLRNLTPEDVRRFGVNGVLVVGVVPNSLAMRSGILVGDIILRVNNRPVSSVEEFSSLIDSLKSAGRETALLLVRRGSGNLFITLRLR
jgi:serine protease Do